MWHKCDVLKMCHNVQYINFFTFLFIVLNCTISKCTVLRRLATRFLLLHFRNILHDHVHTMNLDSLHDFHYPWGAIISLKFFRITDKHILTLTHAELSVCLSVSIFLFLSSPPSSITTSLSFSLSSSLMVWEKKHGGDIQKENWGLRER